MRTCCAALLFTLAFFVSAAPAGQVAVEIRNLQYQPAAVTIHAGDTVVWTNNDDRDHTVVATDGSFKSETIKPGKTYEHQFTTAGRFSYACSIHPRMKGVVVVK